MSQISFTAKDVNLHICILLLTFKVELLSSKKKFYLLQGKLFKNDEKCFLFHPKCSFCSQDIYIFVLASLERQG